MSDKHGGPAFPRRALFIQFSGGESEYHEGYPGMSLRDWFAGQALPEALRQEATGDTGQPCMYDVGAVARVAYDLADAMILERARVRAT